MMILSLVVVLGAELPSAATAGGGLASMARAGQWQQVYGVAVRRAEQLPLTPEEALIAAHAAREVGDGPAAERFFEAALADPAVADVARVELAALVAGRDPDRAVALVQDLLRRAPTRELREAAVAAALAAVAAGLDEPSRTALEVGMPTFHRGTRRSLELALALSRDPVDAAALARILAASTDDAEALAAAERLASVDGLDAVGRWRVAQAFYRHALYDRAAPILEELAAVRHRQVPAWEVAFTRGRCAFRRNRLEEAADWYRRAIAAAAAGERRAELEVHLARVLELSGDMDGAVAAAQRAVRLDTTDDRRLFLARLRLRRGETGLADAGLARLRSRSASDRGALMRGVFELGAGEPGAARSRFAAVQRPPWIGPAAVIGAELAAAAGEPEAALERLVSAVPSLDDYWADRAREVVAALPAEPVGAWRQREALAMEDSSERHRRRALGRALALEPDPARVAALRSRAAVELGLDGEPTEPAFDPGLAAALWGLGLESAALRWDPAGLPRRDARASWWTALRELELGRPWLAISAGDAAWRQASTDIPHRGLPASLRRALYPLPGRAGVEAAARRGGVPWPLLAAVARSESRWNPEVVSKVGARGLLQLMPATAAAVGAANGRPDIAPDELFDPAVSLELGAAELGRLLERFGGNRAAAVAAYNAGEAQAALWLDQCGPVCTEARFLAHVSFSVTRGYTEEVLAAAAAYHELYGPGGLSGRSGSPPAPGMPAPASARSRR